MAIQTVNPFTNKVVRSFEETDKAVDMLVAKSAKTFNSWRNQL
jgi:succinate-semialdehyde dehydrogenase/glutarate-semialdehyde dehydrogenase